MKNIITYLVILIGLTVYSQTLETNYSYDNLNRLVQVVSNDGTTIEYTYDDLGNRTQRIILEPQRTYVPDDAFEQELINLGYDDLMDDYVITDDIDDIELIFLDNLGIVDLTGIEDFQSLGSLFVQNNQISEMDLSQNVNLLRLVCNDNFLNSLDVSNSPGLIELFCDRNNISSINLNQNLSIQVFEASNNSLINLDLSSNSILNRVSVYNNNLESLDIKNENNSILDQFDSVNNPLLFCIQVDDEIAANNGTGVYANWFVDSQVEYSEDCNYLGLRDNQNDFDFFIHPNPTNGELNISFAPTPNLISPIISVFDMQGRLVMEEQVKVENQTVGFSIENLENGIYLINLSENNISSSKLIIKE